MTPRPAVFRVALVVYLLALLWVFLWKDLSLLELQRPRLSWEALGAGGGKVNLLPGSTLLYYLSFRENYLTGAWNIGGNLVGFMPLGILLPLCWARYRRLSAVVGAALLLSGAIEAFQLFSTAGDCDVDDLLLNTAGAAMGFLLLRYVLQRTASGNRA
ncbi:VanZ family protein [Flaviaesturariibacter flavus]|uniref:VanZ family protein n=1 Tax=Flaviaesturariibacter flavus TaxID=2502780 RepID=A0A4V2NWX5_9BACT|nr:VanZ family protein [Flaviaesturariibacter flavus]TCJ19052.1 VanZ family protein [Flaviaesturariibacter flavus]